MSRVAVLGGGLAGLEAAISLAGGSTVEVIERGPTIRRHHVNWDTKAYPGDAKIQRWTGDGWGAGGGLAERLGGRSLCYHGVLLPIESDALADWPAECVDALVGPGGYYERIMQRLKPSYPELHPEGAPAAPLAALGFRRVPQAARFCGETGRFEAYSPLVAVHRLATNSQVRISRGTVQRLRSMRSGRWLVDVIGAGGQTATTGPFDACVLACSAIENVRILSATLDRALTTQITDHFALGTLVRLPPGPPLEPFRHSMLWAGYRRLPELAANVFVHEAAPVLPSGDRILDICAVVEQSTSRGGYSALTVERRADDRPASVHINGRIAEADRCRLGAVSRTVVDLARRLSAGELLALDGGPDDEPSYDSALERILGGAAGRYARYAFPYGAFEHESCTHPLGADGPIGVSSACEVQELPGVYVVGPGSFPRPGAANPALTVLALSQAVAESIRAHYG